MDSQLATLLSEHHLRLTTPRRQIFGELTRAHEPLSIVQLTKLLPDADRVSIYRTIELFTRLGITTAVNYGWKQRYELASPLKPHHPAQDTLKYIQSTLKHLSRPSVKNKTSHHVTITLKLLVHATSVVRRRLIDHSYEKFYNILSCKASIIISDAGFAMKFGCYALSVRNPNVHSNFT